MNKRRFVLKVSEQEFAQLDEMCTREGLTLSNLFRRGLGLPLAEQGFKLVDKGKLRTPKHVRRPVQT